MLDYKKTPLVTQPEVKPAPAMKLAERALYICNEDLRFALDTALVTGRPLLLCGDPGVGKSTFARWVAANAGWRFYKHVVTSHSRPSDLLYRWDAVRRLADAQVIKGDEKRPSPHTYVEPGPLWWAISPESAKRRGAADEGGAEQERLPEAQDIGENWANAERPNQPPEVPADGAVVLIDEIDKAEIDYPNDLLDPLDTYEFSIAELAGKQSPVRLARDLAKGAMPKLLVVITTNDERELPAAFVRRCVTLAIKMPEDLADIAAHHFGSEPGNRLLYQAVAEVLVRIRKESDDGGRRPAIAEYLDAVQACLRLEVRPPVGDAAPSTAWAYVRDLTMAKPAVSSR